MKLPRNLALTFRTIPVLFITYYFPPLAAAGGMRMLKMARYLPEPFLPVILTLQDRRFPTEDPTLLEQVPDYVKVHRTWGLDPFLLGRGGARDAIKRGGGTALWSRYFMIPDNKLGWVPWCVAEGKRIVRREGIRLIWATGPPHSAMMSGARIASATGVPLVLDYRDSWANNSLVRPLPAFHRGLHRRMEAWTLRRAAGATAINPYLSEDVAAYGILKPERIRTIRNGYDPADFPTVPASVPESDGVLRLVYAGNFFAGARTPEPLFRGLALVRDLKWRLDILGARPPFVEELLAQYGLADKVRWLGFLPYRESAALQSTADVLVLLINRYPGTERETTGKIFDYLAARRPILAQVPPEGDAASLIRDLNAGTVVEPDDPEALASAMRELCALRGQGPFSYRQLLEDREPRRDMQAQELGRFFEEVLKEVATDSRRLKPTAG